MKKKYVLIICLVGALALSALYLAPLMIRGDIQFLIVLSGSMDPMLKVGDIIAVANVNPETIEPGDIIAFNDPGGRENIIITHRVIAFDEEGRNFKTKGDACEDPDQFVVAHEEVIGKPVLLLPFMGYLVGPRGSKNPLTWIILVILPSGLIIADEIRGLFIPPSEARKKEKEKRRTERKKRIRVKYTILVPLFLLLAIPSFVIAAPSLVMSGCEEVSPNIEQRVVQNNGVLPCVFVFKTAETVVPYAVLSAGDSREIELPSNTENENSLSVSRVPYVMPVFWIVVLASVSSILPALTTALVPPLSIALLFYPLWLTDIRKRKKRTKRKRRQRLI